MISPHRYYRYLLLPLLLSLILLPGCWSVHELNDEFFVLAVALDHCPKGLQLTVQLVRPGSSLGKPLGTGLVISYAGFWFLSEISLLREGGKVISPG